jgi:hypothetical protein
MSLLYCPECNSYLEGGTGENQDCSCGWEQPPPEPEENYCNWSVDEFEEEGLKYNTSCLRSFFVGNGDLDSNKIMFCLFCGGEITIE